MIVNVPKSSYHHRLINLLTGLQFFLILLNGLPFLDLSHAGEISLQSDQEVTTDSKIQPSEQKTPSGNQEASRNNHQPLDEKTGLLMRMRQEQLLLFDEPLEEEEQLMWDFG